MKKRFWQEKNEVIIVGRNAAKLAQVQAVLPGIKTECLDVSDVASLEQLPNTRHL
ncbi:MAG: hypothetical protein KDJ52_07385 [Anaerolineae bacterium]|nr:hypothetical protein [Anaerolineae bacterium]